MKVACGLSEAFGEAITKSESTRRSILSAGCVNISVGLGSHTPLDTFTGTLASMSLILTIFALVFVTELISWIGKSVLLHFVRLFRTPDSTGSTDANLPLGVDPIPKNLQPECRETTTATQVGNIVKKGRVAPDQCSGPICEVGQTSSECR